MVTSKSNALITSNNDPISHYHLGIFRFYFEMFGGRIHNVHDWSVSNISNVNLLLFYHVHYRFIVNAPLIKAFLKSILIHQQSNKNFLKEYIKSTSIQ